MKESIAKKIKGIRKSMKLTQSEFAELVNLSEDSIGKIERGVSTPTIDTVNNIAAGLNTTVSVILGEEEKKPPARNKALEDLIIYLKSKSPNDVLLIHEVAVKILERKKK